MSTPPSLIRNLRALPPAAWILFAGSFINRFGSFVLPFLVIYFRRRGLPIATAGLALGSYGIGHVVAALLGGHLADRIGRRNTIAISMFAGATTMLVLSQARTLPSVIALTMLAGLTSELYRPASSALITDLVAPEQRMAAFSMYRFAVNLGFAAGPATAGFLASRSFFYVFLGDALTSAGYGCVAILFLPHGLRGSAATERWGEALRTIAHDRRFLLFLASTCCITLVDFQMLSTFALHVAASGFSTATYGALISLNGVLIVLFELLITAVCQRLPPQPVISAGYFLIGLGYALTAFAHTVPALAVTVVFWSLGEMISSPATGAYVSSLAPERYRGRYMGAWVLMFSIGLIFGPSLGTIVYQHSPLVVWGACGVLGTASAILAVMK
jgi:MFS family permease